MAKAKFKKMAKAAEEADYFARFSASNLSHKMYACLACRKNTAVKFVHKDESHAYLACICGWRKRTTNLR